MRALYRAVSPDFTYSQSYLSLLSALAAMLSISMCSASAINYLFSRLNTKKTTKRAFDLRTYGKLFYQTEGEKKSGIGRRGRTLMSKLMTTTRTTASHLKPILPVHTTPRQPLSKANKDALDHTIVYDPEKRDIAEYKLYEALCETKPSLFMSLATEQDEALSSWVL